MLVGLVGWCNGQRELRKRFRWIDVLIGEFYSL